MINTFQKSIIFGTFFISLFCGSLICTSLVTNHWIDSKPWRKANPSQSSGKINFGLLYGRKELNVAFGLRPYEITVADMIQKNESLMFWSLWFVTLFSISLSLVCSGLAAFLAVINSFITPSFAIFSITGIYFTNISSVLLCSIGMIAWTIEFRSQLYTNVLPKEDLENYWTSEGVTKLGFSFWLIAVSAVLHFFNVLLVKWSTLQDQKNHRKSLNSSTRKIAG
ncbi:clarin-2 isoform X2 [Phymastichus coffea]|nr:clarin-2 isoform X2 [Phymastichus coffea]